MSDTRFEEKILYKTHQHWIVFVSSSLKLILYFGLPGFILGYFFSGMSWGWGFLIFLLISIIVVAYDHYLWYHSWLMIGNQKITLTVRNKLFSQYAMNIRYRNIRDSAVSKNSIVGYLLKFGTLFVRSSANEGDFQAHFVPKVGKVYALVNALSRYSDDERSHIHTIEELHAFHQKKEFTTKDETDRSMTLEEGIMRLKNLPGITHVVELTSDARIYIRAHEEIRNTGVMETLSRDNVIVFLHNDAFREASGRMTEKNDSSEIYFPSLPFPEIHGKRVVSSSPGIIIHQYLLQFFPYKEKDDATVLVGWDI